MPWNRSECASWSTGPTTAGSAASRPLAAGSAGAAAVADRLEWERQPPLSRTGVTVAYAHGNASEDPQLWGNVDQILWGCATIGAQFLSAYFGPGSSITLARRHIPGLAVGEEQNAAGGHTGGEDGWIGTCVVETVARDDRKRKWIWELRKRRRPPRMGEWYIESIGSSDADGTFDVA